MRDHSRSADLGESEQAAAAAVEPAVEPPERAAGEPESMPLRPWVRVAAEYLPIVALLLVAAYLCKVFYQPGHDWGDDFALYIHQAKALVNGNVGEVIAVNRYAIDNSGWSSFSPLVYPWGFPLLIAPVVAIWGVDYAKLKTVVILTFLGFLFCIYRLIQRRAGTLAAALVVALMVSSISYIGWTESVLSDFPYLCASGIALLWMDRCRIRERFEAEGIRDLIVLGLLMAYAYSVRREGLGLVAALFAVHAVTVGGRWWNGRSPRAESGSEPAAPAEDGGDVGDDDSGGEPAPPDRPIRWSRLAIPYVTFAGAVIGLQLVLPSVLFPHFAGTGTQQIKPNLIWYRDILAEDIGIKDMGVNHLDLLGHWWTAALALGLLLGLAAVGALVRFVFARAEDAMLIAYVLGVGYIVLTAPFHEGRYLLGIVPWLAYFAYQALPTLAAAARRRRWVGSAVVTGAVVVSAAGLSVFVIANSTDMKHAVDYHRVYNGVINGPTTPAALEMEDVVRRCTRGDDVVVFFRARAMSMLTDRRSIQTGDINLVMTRGDWYVMNKGSTYSQPLVDDAEAKRLGLRKVWENSEWVLWLVPGGAADHRKLPC